jgi:hypothetical protein
LFEWVLQSKTDSDHHSVNPSGISLLVHLVRPSNMMCGLWQMFDFASGRCEAFTFVNLADTFGWRLRFAFLGIFDFGLVLGLQAL